MTRNCIAVTEKNKEIVLKVQEDAIQKDVIDSLKKRMTEIKKIYKEDNEKTIFITGRVFSDEETKEVEDLIKSKLNISISFDFPRILGLHGIKKSYKKEIAVSQTKFHRGALRSGQRIEFEGSLVILGDVNGGAEVIAGENIVVLGILRGLAHAGANGNKEAQIFASSIEAPQVRISNIIKERSSQTTMKRDIKTCAYVNEDGKLIIE